MGLTLVRDFADQLDGEVSIEDKGGTRVHVSFRKPPSSDR
jgi:two-component sensor histidine kinase